MQAQAAAAEREREWLLQQQDGLAARTDLSEADRVRIERRLLQEYGDRARRAMSAARRDSRRAELR